MLKIAIPVFFALALVVFYHTLLIRNGTQFGREGHRQAYMHCIFGILEVVLALAFTVILAVTDTLHHTYEYVLIVFFILILIVSIFFRLRGLIREEDSDSLIEETLYNVKIHNGGRYNRSKIIDGRTENGERRTFVLNGRDREIAKQIRREGIQTVTVVYHTANHRLESVTY